MEGSKSEGATVISAGSSPGLRHPCATLVPAGAGVPCPLSAAPVVRGGADPGLHQKRSALSEQSTGEDQSVPLLQPKNQVSVSSHGKKIGFVRASTKDGSMRCFVQHPLYRKRARREISVSAVSSDSTKGGSEQVLLPRGMGFVMLPAHRLDWGQERWSSLRAPAARV